MPQATRIGGSHPNGLEIAGVPLAVMPGGRVFYVHDNDTTFPHASNNNSGLSADKPLATIDAAVGKCTANRGDIIVVLPGHTESVTANSVDFDVAGIKVIGLGKGSDVPTLDFAVATGTIAIGANNVTLENLRFVANVTTVVDCIIVEDGINYAHIKDCRFEVDAAGTDEFNDCIRFVNNNNYCIVEGCYIDMGIAAAVRGIHLDADTDNLIIRDCHIQGDFSTGNIAGDTTLSTNLLIEDCLLIQGEAGDIGTVAGITLLTGTHGVIRNVDIVCNVATPDLSIVADTMFRFGNRYSETVAGAWAYEIEPQSPDSTYNFIGVDDADNVAATTNVVANRDGSVLERLEHLNAGNVLGQSFIVQKALTSSAIVTGGVDVTGTASGGNIYIENVLVETDASGLATGTLFTIEKNGGSGVLTFFTEAVADLGGNKSEDMSAMDTANIPVVLNSGQKLVAKCTGASCTGGGVITVTLVCRRISDSATVAAAA